MQFPNLVKYTLVIALAALALLVMLQLLQFSDFLAALFAVFVAATVSSTVGFAFSAVAAGILLQIMSDQIAAVEIMLIASIALQIYCVALLWRHIVLARVGWFLLGGLVTIPVGVYALLVLNTRSYAIAIGLVLAIYGLFTLMRPASNLPSGGGGRFADIVVGAIGGVTGPLVAFPGAAVAIWCNARRWDKLTQRCVYQPYILIMQIATLAVLAIIGETKRIDTSHILFIIPAISGAHIGLRVFARMTDAEFKALVNVLLILSGLWILARGLN
jgi:uncharacterized protein